MPEKPCDPFPQCTDLDTRVLISTAVQGPPLAWEMGEITFGQFTAQGAAVRAYVDITLAQQWVAREACYGPIRSIFSLAPGETVQITTTVRHTVEITSMVEHATGSQRELRTTGSPFGAMSHNQLLMPTRQVAKLGSIFDDFVGAVSAGAEALAGPVVAVVNGVAGLITHAVGGGHGPAVNDAVAHAQNSVTTIDTSESQKSRSETVREDETIQTVVRTFSNPYRDRSLQLRFIPTFRRFEVTTFLHSVKPGVSLHLGPIQQHGSTNMVAGQLKNAATQMQSRHEVGSLQRPLMEMLGRDRATDSRTGDVKSAMLWSESHVREDSLFVPLASAVHAAAAFGLKGSAKSDFEKQIGVLHPDVLAKLKRPAPTDVHLLMGTHIEPVAGGCILTDVPPLV